MLIDTHLHLSEESEENIKKIVKEAIDNKVEKFIVSGTNIIDNKYNISLSKKFKEIYLALGYHPSEVDSITLDDLSLLEQLTKKTNKVVAIGEIGLDYYYGKDTKEKQKDLFEKQLALAEKYNLPVVIHNRDATEDTINILKKYKVKGVFHCFSGSLETAKELIEMDFYLGIGGVITFKNSNLKEVIKNISLDYIILETDSPYLSPERGNKNSPKNIKIIAEYLANLKEISLENVANITTNNACCLFDLEK